MVPILREHDVAEKHAFMAGKRCLVLEDEFLIALDIQQVLEVAGASAVTFGSADDAMTALRGGGAFDVAILDLRLSDSSQDSMAIAALLSERGTPFVFLTGMRADNADVQKFPHAPVVEKPYQVEGLMEALAKALGRA